MGIACFMTVKDPQQENTKKKKEKRKKGGDVLSNICC